MAIQGKDIEKTTSYSKTQISPIFIKDERYQEPTYVIATGIDGKIKTIIDTSITGTIFGRKIFVGNSGNQIFTEDIEAGETIKITTLSPAPISIIVSEKIEGQGTPKLLVSLDDFIGSVGFTIPPIFKKVELTIYASADNTPVYIVHQKNGFEEGYG